MSLDSTDLPEQVAAATGATIHVGEAGPEMVTVSGGGTTVHPASAVDEPPPSKRIGIVGFTESRSQAPYGSDEWELWGLNNLYARPDVDASKFSAWFDIHPPALVEDSAAHVEWLTKGSDGLPVFMFYPRPEWPNAREFPRGEVAEAFRFPGLTDQPYFTNSIAWMVAFAILLLNTRCEQYGWDPAECEIGVWGIDMAELRSDGTLGEYASQRPSCEFYLGFAKALGYQVTVAETSDLCKTALLYGEEDLPLIKKMREKIEVHVEQLKWLQDHIQAKHREKAEFIAQKDAEIEDFTARFHANLGAKNALEALLGTWAPAGNHGNSTHEDAPKEAA